MTLDLLDRAGLLDDDVQVEPRRERGRGASGRGPSIFTLSRHSRKDWAAPFGPPGGRAVIDVYPDTLVLLAVVVLALAACVLGWFLIGPRK
jgi:hypothetical protein